MTTYNTYQEAKIANPESEIYFDDFHKCFQSTAYKGCSLGNLTKCNPADYCMTVEKFLADGHKFVVGDVMLSSIGKVESVTVPEWCNERRRLDNERFALRAAALNKTETPEEKEAFDVMNKGNADDLDGESVTAEEIVDLSLRDSFDVMAQDNEVVEVEVVSNSNVIMESKRGIAAIRTLESRGYTWNGGEQWKPPLGERPKWLDAKQPKPKHTKEEYVKVDFDHAWQAVKEFEDGVTLLTDENHFELRLDQIVPRFERGDGFCCKVVTELTPREAFIEEVEKIAEDITQDEWSFACIATAMFDSGKFKLVEGE